MSRIFRIRRGLGVAALDQRQDLFRSVRFLELYPMHSCSLRSPDRKQGDTLTAYAIDTGPTDLKRVCFSAVAQSGCNARWVLRWRVSFSVV